MSLKTHCAELSVDHFPVILQQSVGPAGDAKYYSTLWNKESGVLCQKTQGRILPRRPLPHSVLLSLWVKEGGSRGAAGPRLR